LTLNQYDIARHYGGWRKFLNDDRLYSSLRNGDKKDLFRKYIRHVEIEVFSFCNRRCPFCANSYIDRHSGNTLMPPETYSKVIDALAEIDYAGKIWYSRYNEPLSDRVILDRIREARSKLHKATLNTFTNGDYVTRDYLEELAKAGLNHIRIMRYPPTSEEYSEEKSWETLFGFAKKLDLPFQKEWGVSLHLEHPTMDIHILGADLKTFVRNRAGSVKTSCSANRTSPCFSPFTNIYIDYNGSVVPCCNVRSDVPEHNEMVMGNVNEQSIFDIFANFRYSLLRYQMRDFGVKVYPCRVCDNNGYSFSGQVPQEETKGV
jgi:MoaA/NifB/PqqE/SkfB family radical SAM enzyme